MPPSGAFSPESRTTKPGQIAALAAEAVGEPRADARAAEHLAARVHEDLAGRVVELRRVHRADDGDVVGDGRQVRQQLRELGARLAVLLERERRAEQARRALDEREPLSLRNELRGNLLAVVLLQRRLVVEQIELRRRARHEQIDDVLRLRREVRRARAPSGLRPPAAANSRSSSSARQRHAADAEAGLLEEMAARDVAKSVRVHSLPGQRFIEVQERVGDERPRRLFGGDRRRRPRIL